MNNNGSNSMNPVTAFNVSPQRFARLFGVLATVPALLGVILLAGCTLGGRGDTALILEPPRAAAEVFNEGLAYIEAGRYGSAIDSFDELNQFYPYTSDARRGTVLTVFAAYQDGEHQLAIDTAKQFLLLYPTHEDTDYVLFLMGEAHMRAVPDVTRDQQTTREALSAFEELLERFPNSQYADQARVNIIAIRDQLAGQEMLIGRFYQERRDYAAAINRFRVVVADYQDTRHVEEALFRLTETYLAMGLVSEAQTAGAILGHNFPESVWYGDAYALLGAGGVEPSQNGGSWLSRIFGGDG